jgi:putative endopeptidase
MMRPDRTIRTATKYIFQLGQGGLGLPNRDYYFKTDEKSTKVRQAYQQYLLLTFRQLGSDSIAAGKQAADVFALETKLAGASRKLADLRDPNKNYNKLSRSALQSLTPHISWEDWFHNAGISHIDSVIVGQPEFYRPSTQPSPAPPSRPGKTIYRHTSSCQVHPISTA